MDMGGRHLGSGFTCAGLAPRTAGDESMGGAQMREMTPPMSAIRDEPASQDDTSSWNSTSQRCSSVSEREPIHP